jgi:hypothetical protein
MLRSRIREHIANLIQEDILSIFGKKVELGSMECSIILQNQDEEKRKLAKGLLEILTGQKPSIVRCNPIQEDPNFMGLSSREKKEFENTRGRILSQKNSNFAKNSKNFDKEMVSKELKKNEFGTKLNCSLRKVNLYSFLEKLKDFYLPEVIGKKIIDYNSMEGNDLKKYFVNYRSEKKSNNTIEMKKNDLSTTYVLKSTDLLKFPDLELHFQQLNSLFQISRGNLPKSDEASKNNSISLIVTPNLKIINPYKEKTKIEEYCNMKIINCILSQIFNPYSERIMYN